MIAVRGWLGLPLVRPSTHCRRQQGLAQQANQWVRVCVLSRKLSQYGQRSTWARAKVRAAQNDSVIRPSETDLSGFLDRNFARRLHLSDGLLQQLAELPGTYDHSVLRSRAEALADWRARLTRGILPQPKRWEWPQEPFQSTFAKAMRSLEMPRFCRRYPKLTDAVLRQMLELLQEFEAKLEELKAQQEQQERNRSNPQQKGEPLPQQQPPQPGDGPPQSSDDPSAEQQESEPGEGGEDGRSPEELTQEQLEEALSKGAAKPSDQGQSLQMQLDSTEGAAPDMEQMAKDMEDAVAKAATDLVKEFEDKWKPLMQNLEEAEDTFEDLSALMDGPKGFDASHAMWRASGWREVRELRRRLQELKELRELVRSLGRSGGKGPIRRAPEQIFAQQGRPGVIRSELQPEETCGLTRSGDLSRMLPFEAHLLAAGWQAQDDAESQTSVAESKPSTSGAAVATAERTAPAAQKGAAQRRLFMVRRAERMLGSYQREGWLEDQPSRATGRFEIRPAAEQGPIIVCLDTSGSMTGPRETVAKAVALECMRGAHRQGRACYLYAFSGPGDVQGIELDTKPDALGKLLSFLAHSFGGGTDVDAPLDLSLKRVAQAAWSQADILLVSDGEIPYASQDIKARLSAAREELDLQVHGLLVGQPHATAAMNELCTHLHIFKSWDAAGARSKSDGRW